MLAILGMLAIFAVSRLRPTSFEIVIVLAPFMFYLSVGGDVNVSAADILAPFAMVHIWLSRSRPSGSRRLDGIWIYAASVIGVLALSLIVQTLSGVVVSIPAGEVSLAKWIIVFAYLLWASHCAAAAVRRKDFRFLKAWTWTASLISVISILGVAGLMPYGYAVIGGRSSGTFEDPNLFGTYLVVSLSLIPVAAKYSGFRFPAVHGILMTLGVITTASRGTYAAVIVMILISLLSVSGKGARFRLALALSVAFAGAWYLVTQVGSSLFAASLGRVVQATSVAESDIRLSLWEVAIEGWQKHPFLGLGPGQFYFASGGLFNSNHGGVTHNTYLAILAESGLIGVVTFMSFWLVVFGGLLLRRHVNPVAGAFLAGLSALGTEMFSLNLENLRFVWIYLAIAWAMSKCVDPCSDISPRGVELGVFR